ncbi:MAG: glycosyltransferase, partial [Planctomycetota bacterium]
MTELRFSLVLPIYNEEENVPRLLDEIWSVLAEAGPMEVILVDDCSSDLSLQIALGFKQEQAADWLRVLGLESRCGQSAAVMAGAENSRAPIVMTMDGDLQNDPRDLLRMLEMLEAGDCQGVTGVRADRQDSWLRLLSSRIGNGVRNVITGDRVSDSACGIKAYGREFFLRAPRFDGMHRFMATLV